MPPNNLKDNLLRILIQKEIEEARSLEARGKLKEASEGYSRVGEAYRKMAYDSPPDSAQKIFQTASEYESLSRSLMNLPENGSLGLLIDQTDFLEELFISQKPEVEWDQIGGLEDVKGKLQGSIDSGIKTILLYGPLGTGKNLLARASAKEIQANLFEIMLTGLLSWHFGESSAKTQALLSRARKSKPSILFIEEISYSDEYSQRAYKHFLSEITALKDSEAGVIVIAASTKPWDLEEEGFSIFQKAINVPLPDVVTRKSILSSHLQGADLSKISIDEIAHQTEGFSGLDISNLCHEAITQMILQQNPSLKTLTFKEVESLPFSQRPLQEDDFRSGIERIKPTVKPEEIEKYLKWRGERGGEQ
jgi:SpoVK/Ycf46/Vps4 family AAA+-type ATPase